MTNVFVNGEGGLTGPGYALCILLALAALLLAARLRGGRERAGGGARKLAFCAMSLALGFTLSFVKVLPLPFGGSATLCSMLFIVLTGYWYGPETGLLMGFVYGMLQFLQGPYVLSLLQVGCDYLLAFTCLGLGGFFRGKRQGLIAGYLTSVAARGAFHALGGYLFWMEYMPDSFPRSIAFLYPVVYNYGYLLAEALITVLLLSVPSVRSAIDRVGRLAVQDTPA